MSFARFGGPAVGPFRQCPHCGHWVPQDDDCPAPPDYCHHVRTLPLSAVQRIRCEGCDDA